MFLRKMENDQITHVDGEPPVYGEMKPVPVILDSCLINTDDNFPYNDDKDTLVTKDNCDDGELSAEEISSMIMINEGPNVLSSVQEELESSKGNFSLRNSSDIKKILTSDLPKTGRFLSTKSLQKLSGAKKAIRKNPKYENETSDDTSDGKLKKAFIKQNKSIKENLDKSSQSKILESEIPKKNIKSEKFKMKSLKKGNSLEKLSGKKKSLKTFKKIGLSKNKDISSSTKIFKKKVLESNSVVKKERIFKNSESVTDKTTGETNNDKKKCKTEKRPKLLISRSGRIRKLKDISEDFVMTKNKEGKVVNAVDNELTGPVFESEKKMEMKKEVKHVEEGLKFESGKENKSQGDLLQSALSESVESWFDIDAGEEKKKWARGKVKIIPRDSDACFEETKNLEADMDLKSKCTSKAAEEIEMHDSKNETLKNKKEESSSNVAGEEQMKNEEETRSSLNPDKPDSEDAGNKKNLKVEVKDNLPKAEEVKTEDTKKTTAPSSKKSKPVNRQVLGYKKKRRKPKNIIVSSYLKNYGEKIDFNVKLDPKKEVEEIKVLLKTDAADPKTSTKKSETSKDEEKKKELSLKLDDTQLSNSVKNFSDVKASPQEKLESDESLKTSIEPKMESPQKNAEMPESIADRKDETELIETKAPLDEKAGEEIQSLKLTKTENEKIEPDDSAKCKEKPKLDVVEKKDFSLSEEKKSEESAIVDNSESKEKELKNDNLKIEKKVHQKRRSPMHKTRVFGMKNKKKIRALSRKEKLISFKKMTSDAMQTKQSEESKLKEVKAVQKSSRIDENTKSDESPQDPKENLTPEVCESFPTSSALSIPFKKRPRRTKTNEDLEEVKREVKEEEKKEAKEEAKKEAKEEVKKEAKEEAKKEAKEEAKKEAKEEVNNSERQDCERRKSHREIKLTPKIVDMIATSFSHKRSRKTSSSKDEELPVLKENLESSNLTKKSGSERDSKTPGKEASLDQPLVAVPFVENYLQSKMEANASNFESSWEPGDLVWARFAGNPFWPALILRDPFSNDEYSKVKYLGRLPRPFVHVQFLADYGRRAWGPELYIMNFNGLDEFEKLKSSLPEVNAFTVRKDLLYQQAFFTPKKMEKNWMEAVKEGETLISKSKDERITYMKIKYPLVKYAASVANGCLVPNERTKVGDTKSPGSKGRKRQSLTNASTPDGSSNNWSSKKGEEPLGKDTFECFNTSDLDERKEKTEKESPKITLKLVRSPKKGSKRKSSKLVDDADEKKIKKKIRKEVLDEDCFPSDSNSNGEKSSETTSSKQKKYCLFKGAKTEKVCQICLEILENEKTIKCKGSCQGLFHKSCAEKMSEDLPPSEEIPTKGVRNKRRKKLFIDAESDNSTDAQSKESEEKEWRCTDCLRGENPCFVCNGRNGNRQRCCVAYCGKFYHQKCLKLYPQTIYNQGAPFRKSQYQQKNKSAESESPHYQILSCPLHVCHTCASDNPADFNMKYLCEKLVKCIKCPSAYHGGNYCVPAGSTILNTTQIICAKHGDPGKKSHVNISWCFICNMGGSLICCEWCPSSFHLDCLNIKPPDGPYICEECESGRFPLYGEVVWVKLGRYRWWPARVLFPQEILPNIMALPHKPWEFAVRFYGSNDHYWLNRGRVFLYQEGDSEQKFKGQSHVDKIYQRAVQEATKDYFAVQEERKSRLLGTNNSGVMKPPPYVKIKTNKPVGKVQLGNATQSEPQTCDCDSNSEAPCSPGSDCLNRMLLVECNPNYCNAGSRCWNQSFEKREYPPLEPYRTERRGWGLRSSIDIPKGSFIIEYVGEVVDDEEFKRRMKRKQEIKDSNYYFLTIDKDRMIDAGPKGNLARFMNHSCSPNCETQKWTVNGDTRVGLFALRDIPAGTELTFNYNLDCIGNEKKACHCEEENCSGFIGIKAKNDKSEALKNKMMKRSEKESEDDCFVCGDGGELMVCDVPNCPKVYHMECVNLSEWPNELWFCPRHQCSLCMRTTKRCCKLCPTAYCFAHLDNNMFPDNQGGLLCSKHSTCAVKPAQTLRKASYINRNTPVVEYEKPFAEKYRPPLLKDRSSPEDKKEEILMEPNLTDNTPIVVENPLLSSGTPSRLTDGVSVQVLYVDEEGQIVSVDETTTTTTGEPINSICEREAPKPIKRKKRTNIPRKKLNPPVAVEETGNKPKSPTPGGINFESLMIKSVEDKILDSKLNMDNIYNIIGGGGGGEGETGHSETDSAEKCVRDDSNELKSETVNKKEEAEVDRSRRSKYFKIVTPEKFIKVSESESNQKKVTDFNYIEFMHPLRSARSKSKTDENTRK